MRNALWVAAVLAVLIAAVIFIVLHVDVQIHSSIVPSLSTMRLPAFLLSST